MVQFQFPNSRVIYTQTVSRKIMKAGGGVVFVCPRAVAFPGIFFGHRRPAFRCYSSPSSSSSPDHVSFIKDVAATQPPEHLNQLLKILKVRGEEIISPGAKQGLIPLVIPLSRRNSDSVTALLRWPTAPSGMEMPLVEVRKYGVWLLAKNVDQYIHRVLVEEDANGHQERADELFRISADAGKKLYEKGDFGASNISSLDTYILKKVGLFPDVLERRIKQHFDNGDNISALVTGEFYTKKEHFPGFARPFVFNAEVLLKSVYRIVFLPSYICISIKQVISTVYLPMLLFFSRVGRNIEAKDAARGALKSPWWTLGCEYHEVANMAEWEDEQIEYIREKVTEEGKQADLKKGKEPAQVALDEAAFLLDLASIDGAWDDNVERIAECYKEAGLPEVANFVVYRD
ncbi:protein IN CHLOROPLAST ATPASE BIOGENESIS, chloroplastic isoform X1 [Capsicum annuum]